MRSAARSAQSEQKQRDLLFRPTRRCSTVSMMAKERRAFAGMDGEPCGGISDAITPKISCAQASREPSRKIMSTNVSHHRREESKQVCASDRPHFATCRFLMTIKCRHISIGDLVNCISCQQLPCLGNYIHGGFAAGAVAAGVSPRTKPSSRTRRYSSRPFSRQQMSAARF